MRSKSQIFMLMSRCNATGVVVIYGPFKKDNRFTSASNAEFDKSLRMQNPEWGYRDTGQVAQEAKKNGLALQDVKDMPANNFLLTFAKSKGK